jgi:hypothetical protein
MQAETQTEIQVETQTEIQVRAQAGMRVLPEATPADLLVMIQLVMMAELRQHLL